MEVPKEFIKALTSKDRVECRQYRRLFDTPDGKAVLESIKRDIGWDEACPPDGMSRKEWTGLRRVVRGILNKISLADRIDADEDPTE